MGLKYKNKISWNDYFMSIAEAVSKRSMDPSSKYGCVAVDQENSILSTGYNGPPRNVHDDTIPLTRPEKYTYMEHAERNCIYNAARKGIALDGCTFYVTGMPCTDCLRAMYQVGAFKVIYLDRVATSANDEWYKLLEFLSKYMHVEIMPMKGKKHES